MYNSASFKWKLPSAIILYFSHCWGISSSPVATVAFGGSAPKIFYVPPNFEHADSFSLLIITAVCFAQRDEWNPHPCNIASNHHRFNHDLLVCLSPFLCLLPKLVRATNISSVNYVAMLCDPGGGGTATL